VNPWLEYHKLDRVQEGSKDERISRTLSQGVKMRSQDGSALTNCTVEGDPSGFLRFRTKIMANYHMIDSVEEYDQWKMRHTPGDHQGNACIRPTSDKKRCNVAHILPVSNTKQHPRQNPN